MHKGYVDAHKSWGKFKVESPIKAIKFSASWPEPGSYGLIKNRTVLFELGLGPCGKHVLKLAYEVDDHLLRVTQESRHPDDLEPPEAPMDAFFKRGKHLTAKRLSQRPPKLTYKAGEPVQIGWWIFKMGTHTPLEMVVEEPEPNPDILTDEQLKELYKVLTEHNLAFQAWKDRLEVKHFVYKMSDVHGRIEATR